MPASVKFSSDFILGITWHLENPWLVNFVIGKEQLDFPGHATVGPHVDPQPALARSLPIYPLFSVTPAETVSACGLCLHLCMYL